MKTIPRTVRAVVAAALTAFLIATTAATTPAHALGTPAQEQTKHGQMIANIVDEHNKHRAAHNLPALKFSPAISLRVPQVFTNELAAKNNGTIWHNTAARIGAGGSTWGENVAGGYKAETAAQLVNRWMNSAGHKQNILNANYTTISVGFAHADTGDWTFSTVNFYKTPTNAGVTYTSGAAWLTAAGGHGSSSTVNVYTTPGNHTVNGRQWRTTCEAYTSAPRKIDRCRAEIWGTVITYANGKYSQANGWNFNNLTYLPAPRAWWAGNPLAQNGEFTSGGRDWKTSCGDSWTGPNGCRSFIKTNVVTSDIVNGVRVYRVVPNQWVFNNIVMFNG